MICDWQVKWEDGMLLTENEFQQQQDSICSHLVRRQNCIDKHVWGFSKLDIEQNSGDVIIHAASGIFPNGMYFHCTGSENELTIDEELVYEDIYLSYLTDVYFERTLANSVKQYRPKFILTHKPEFSKSLLLLKSAALNEKSIIHYNEKHIQPHLNILNHSMAKGYIDSFIRIIKNSDIDFPIELSASLYRASEEETLHPYELYKILYTWHHYFKIDGAFKYEHRNPNFLIKKIQDLIEAINASKSDYTKIQLVQDGFYWRTLEPLAAPLPKQLIISIPYLAPGNYIPPQSIKVSSADNIERIVKHATQGMQLHLLKLAPAGFIITDTQLFEIALHNNSQQIIKEGDFLAFSLTLEHSTEEPTLWMKS
jgi:predicted component of type VI protein secretion system